MLLYFFIAGVVGYVAIGVDIEEPLAVPFALFWPIGITVAIGALFGHLIVQMINKIKN